jgi:CHAT domain-containing protein
VSFEELLRRVAGRIESYERSGDTTFVWDDAVRGETAALWAAVQPGDPQAPTEQERARIVAAQHTIGCLHYFRHVSAPGGVSPGDLARALIWLAPLANRPDIIPPPLLMLIGPAPDLDAQFQIAGALLESSTDLPERQLIDASLLLYEKVLGTLPARHPRADELLFGMSLGMRRRYKYTVAPPELQQAIALGEQALAITPQDHPDRARRLHNLCLALRNSYDITAAVDDLYRAAELGTQALAHTPDGHRDRVTFLSNLGGVNRQLYERTGDPAHLDQAVELGEAAIAATRADDPARTIRLSTLGMTFHQRYQHTGELTDLDRYVGLLTEAVDADQPGSPSEANTLNTLSSAYQTRYRRTDQTADLTSAVDTGNRALRAVPPNHQDRPLFLANLSSAHLSRAERTGDRTDLERAIDLGTEAVSTAPADHWELARYLSGLADAHTRRYERVGDATDLERAIELGAKAVELTPAGHPSLGARQIILAGSYLARYERTGVLADIDRAIEHDTSAIAGKPDVHENAVPLVNLCIAHRIRYERTGAVADLEHALAYGTQAIDRTADGHPALPNRQATLASAYRQRYERTGEQADLAHAIELDEQAIAATPDDHPRSSAVLSNLGFDHRLRYEATGSPADLDRAIELGDRAVAAMPEDEPDRAMSLSVLGGSYHRRYERTGVLVDLDWSVRLSGQAVAATPGGHTELPKRLVVLAAAYVDRYVRTDSGADLDEAVVLGQRVLDELPGDHADRCVYLSNVSLIYRRRYLEAGQSADLTRSIELVEDAVASAQPDRPAFPGYVGNLSSTHRLAYERTGDADHLRLAIEHGERAIAVSPDGHPDLARWLTSLARAYLAQAERDGGIDRGVLTALIDRLPAAATSAPDDLVEVNTLLGSFALALAEPATAVELLDAAVALLPTVVPRATGWSDQEHQLSRHAGLVSEAVAAHCEIGDPVGAVQVAELGRGILLANHLDSRTDLSDLGQAQPTLAIRLAQLRAQLNAPGIPADVSTHSDRQRLWTEHDELLREIRQHKDFSGFLLPPGPAQLRPPSADGAVLLVSAGQSRSDAIIITADADPVAVALPDLTYADVEARALELLEVTHDTRTLTGALRRQRVVPEILGWLWDTVARPVLDALPARGDGTLPRVWWMPTGLLGLFPLHAAGHQDQDGALDRVVSSYTPTLRTLRYAHDRPSARRREQLIVALAHTPQLPDLPGTAAEAGELHDRYPGQPPLTDKGATRAGVLAALPDSTWAHFACHASADLMAPSQGGLWLHDGLLPVQDITRLDLADAELAYLSACSTASRGWQHADESIHLASAFQLAGFKHVIASLWPLEDTAAAAAAREFYGRAENADDAARALHEVTRTLRGNAPDRPDLWAALLHSGP